MQALRHLALAETDQALRCYLTIVRHVPHDLDTRMKVADVLVQAGLPQLASRVYAALAWCDLQGGRPLHALVCCQALADLGQSVGPIHESLAELYGAESGRLSKGEHGAGRLPPPAADLDVPGELLDVPAAVLFEVAAEMAADTATFTAFPPSLAPIPLLSELPRAAFVPVMQAALIRRLGPRVPFLKEGSPAYSLFFLASGTVRIGRGDPESTGQPTLRTLCEGDLLGELALLSPRPRAATATTLEPADLIELPVKALRDACAGDLEAEAALERCARERLLKILVAGDPLFAAFPTGQKLELLQHFSSHEVGAGTILQREGELGEGLYVLRSGSAEVLRGEEPFETVERRLGAGDIFGGLLTNGARARATVRAGERTTVLLLARETFERLCKTVPQIHKGLKRLSDDPEALREASRPGRSVWSVLELLPEERDPEFPYFI